MGNVCYKRNKPTKKITVDRLSEYIKMKKHGYTNLQIYEFFINSPDYD
jgi:hypothetical protein